MGLSSTRGDDHAQTTAMGGHGRGGPGDTRRVPREAEPSGLGRRERPLNSICRVIVAWLALLLGGSSLMLTGQLDWWGLYGERAVFVLALAAASFTLWWLGERTSAERVACRAGLALCLVAFLLFPAGTRLQFNLIGIAPVHLALCAQLGAWDLASGRAARRGLWIIAGGMAIEALLVIPAAQLVAPDAVCATGTMLACLDGPFVAIMLPAAVTAALILCWLNPMAAALRGRGRS